ncbi:type VI secretion system protein ImpK [Paraburkholderia sp. HC6.4b]|uniref:type IVB secretion system protein IcmH/DotU n=1 Tax=unclassified Paraburkholderia TaxID=2615204 RepID=UPI00161AA214|nr:MULTISPECIES: type IVB secretion system protein IcmH/DotU [unclassified Paraburkholderia]MBB5413877.1 type VI secretion system protein ImpK [Paraburkholderia sp. HC6.4b]MBB5456301.1 type VI secretion system protein ImpK [Paraburkholderia sp. Kb1A]
MSLLRNLSTALRRVPSADQLDPASANPLLATRLATLASSSADALPRVDEAPCHSAVLQLPVAGGTAKADTRQGSAPVLVHGARGEQTAISKAGQQQATWSNPFVSHALPAMLQLQRYRATAPLSQSAIRTQFGLEVRLYRERLAGSGCEWEQTRDASYLLCTFLDETVNDLAREQSQTVYDGERSLLVEFHDDAWGGEDAFADLSRWMKAAEPPVALLSFYELILSFGWRGRYRVLDRGDLLLQDLRSQLHALVWHHAQPGPLGTELFEPPKRRRSWWNPTRAAAVSLGALALAYGAISVGLDSQGRPIRHALAAWMPPTRTINLAETLPPPLPQLLTEGWLTAYKHPQGWLLVFRSDGAFDAGKAGVRPDFINNIERLGLAFAPWPGDLEVIGHTDPQPIHTGEFPDNQALSEARARTVADELRKTALPGGSHAPQNAVQRNIQYSGRGDSQPIDPARTPAAYERNRRVDVLWKVIPDGGARRESGVELRRPVSPADAAARPAMPEGVVIAPEPQSPYATTEGRQP